MGPWRGDHSTAYVAPLPDAPLPSADFVRRCLALLAERGFARVVTGALAPGEQRSFLQAGFGVAEELHVLSLRLGNVRPPEIADGVRLRRARREDRPAVLAVDNLSFPAFWRLDLVGIEDAIRATPRARFRVAEVDHGEDGPSVVSGYAICGRASFRGYVQRLAVKPDDRRRGVGSALLLDGLRWLQRWGAKEAVVNTQRDNTVALDLYQRHGFTRRDTGLRVLEAPTGP